MVAVVVAGGVAETRRGGWGHSNRAVSFRPGWVGQARVREIMAILHFFPFRCD